MARTRAIKVMDYAMQTDDGSAACERFVDSLGLKSLFSAFMGRVGVPDHLVANLMRLTREQAEGKKKKAVGLTFEDDEHILSILASLFTNLASDTPQRIRLVAKFVENEYEKVERLLELRDAAVDRGRAVEREIEQERRVLEANKEEITDEDEGEWYLRRLDAGLSALQNADYVLAWVCMEDDGVSTLESQGLVQADHDTRHVSTQRRSSTGRIKPWRVWWTSYQVSLATTDSSMRP